MKLSNCTITGFFSLPSPYLAEHNPSAYTNAMARVPAGAGSCHHCGRGIIHHVVVRDGEGHTHFIGTDCAEKVGLDRECLRSRLTTEERAARDAYFQAKRDRQAQEDIAWEIEWKRWQAGHLAEVGHIVNLLRSYGDNEFFTSLATQLRDGWLSPRQAYCVARSTSETGRRNKKNAAAWDAICDLCTGNEESEQPPFYYTWRKAYRETLAK